MCDVCCFLMIISSSCDGSGGRVSVSWVSDGRLKSYNVSDMFVCARVFTCVHEVGIYVCMYIYVQIYIYACILDLKTAYIP